MGHRGQTRKASRGHGHSEIPMHAITFHGVQEWHKAEFEKYGWMLLARAKGYDFKIAAYKKGIDHLIASIKHLATEYSCPDRLHDLNVLLMNVMVLKGHASRL